METHSEVAPEAADMQQPCGGTDAAVLPRQTRTRQGKARLLTLDALDSRTAAAKAARHLIDTLTADMGGDDQLSAGERQLVQRAAMTVRSSPTSRRAGWRASRLSSTNTWRRSTCSAACWRRWGCVVERAT